MFLFYKEKNGAYLVIDTESNQYFLDLGEDAFEGRSCITYHADPSYVNTGTISREYLKECKRVARKDVPKKWLEMLV